jgi:hypothetical protein
VAPRNLFARHHQDVLRVPADAARAAQRYALALDCLQPSLGGSCHETEKLRMEPLQCQFFCTEQHTVPPRPARSSESPSVYLNYGQWLANKWTELVVHTPTNTVELFWWRKPAAAFGKAAAYGVDRTVVAEITKTPLNIIVRFEAKSGMQGLQQGIQIQPLHLFRRRTPYHP